MDKGFVPPALRNKPVLQGFDTEVWNAFARLSARRNIGGFGAMSAIPYVEIASYLDIVLKLDDEEDRDLFIELVEFLDNLFLKAHAERQRKEHEAKAKPKSAIIRP